MPAFIRSRDIPHISLIERIAELYKQVFCCHYWYSESADPYTYVRFKAKCLKCGKTAYVPGVMLEEIEEIAETY